MDRYTAYTTPPATSATSAPRQFRRSAHSTATTTASSVARRQWVPAAVAAVAGSVVYAVYFVIDTVPREFAAYAPQLVTLLVLAVASQRLRPPAADGLEYRRGEGD